MNYAEILAKNRADLRAFEDRLLGQPQTSPASSEVEDNENENAGLGLDGFAPGNLGYVRLRAEQGDEVAIQLLAEAEEEDPEQGSADAGRRGPTRRKSSVAEQFNAAVIEGRDPHSAPRSINEARRRKEKGVVVFQ